MVVSEIVDVLRFTIAEEILVGVASMVNVAESDPLRALRRVAFADA